MDFFRKLDPKLVSTVLSYLATYAVVHVLGVIDTTGAVIPGFLSWDNAIALTVATVVGYLWPNDGTVLRQSQEDGNAEVPEAGHGAIELLVYVLVVVLLVLLVIRLI